MRKILSVVLTFAMLLVMCPSAFAKERQPTCTQNEENHITFSGLSQLSVSESLEYVVEEADGTEAVVGIRRMPDISRSSGETWQVWYKYIGLSAEFYMTVSNNKVTSVYDYSISVLGGSYDDAELSRTSTYGKLTFTLKSVGGIAASTCWLKGTVTGEDDQIDVTWQM